MKIDVPLEALAEFCRHWRILRLEVFGSALREDFRDGSDVDLLVTFDADARWSLVDHAQMENELIRLLGREVDLVTRRSVERSLNSIRRREILGTARTLYAA
jgi:uncharacterized protein